MVAVAVVMVLVVAATLYACIRTSGRISQAEDREVFHVGL